MRRNTVTPSDTENVRKMYLERENIISSHCAGEIMGFPGHNEKENINLLSLYIKKNLFKTNTTIKSDQTDL